MTGAILGFWAIFACWSSTEEADARDLASGVVRLSGHWRLLLLQLRSSKLFTVVDACAGISCDFTLFCNLGNPTEADVGAVKDDTLLGTLSFALLQLLITGSRLGARNLLERDRGLSLPAPSIIGCGEWSFALMREKNNKKKLSKNPFGHWYKINPKYVINFNLPDPNHCLYVFFLHTNKICPETPKKNFLLAPTR